MTALIVAAESEPSSRPEPQNTAQVQAQAQTEASQADALFVRRVLAGETSAYEELVRRHQQRIYATVYHMTSNHEDATDLTQETFIKAYQALASFKGDSSFYTWVYRIAVNKTLNYLKSRKQRTFMSLNDLDVQVENNPDLVALIHDKTPRRDAGLNEIQQRLNEALLKLSDTHRMVVTLHDIQGLPHEEIARIMECNVGTVRSRLFYARQQLQAWLSDLLE